MAEGRPPEDLQEAVAATLRRLRGEVGAARPAAPRVEPQFIAPAPAAEEPELEPAEPEPAEPPPAAAAPAEPDLLSAVTPQADVPQTDIPPAPSSYQPAVQAPAIEVPEPRARTSYDAPDAGEADAETDTGAPSHRHWLRYVVAFAVLVVFAVVGWWAYRHFAGRASNGQIPVVTADQTPEKVPPADQPANQTPDQQETVYNQISPGGSSTTQQPEVLLPQPEQPATPPAAPTAPSTSASNGSSGTGTNGAGNTTAGASGATPPAAPAAPAATGSSGGSSGGIGALTETLLPSSSPPAANPPPPAPPAAGTSQGTTGQAASEAPAQTATTAPSAPATTGTTEGGTTEGGQTDSGATTTPAPANDAPTAAGNYRVQLAALKSEADAKTAWKRLAAKYPDVLGSLSLHLEKADLGTKGIYYRVQAGPFTDKNAARDICAKLKAKGQQCLVKP